MLGLNRPAGTLGIPEDRIPITLRPPATMALYLDFENPFF